MTFVKDLRVHIDVMIGWQEEARDGQKGPGNVNLLKSLIVFWRFLIFAALARPPAE